MLTTSCSRLAGRCWIAVFHSTLVPYPR